MKRETMIEIKQLTVGYKKGRQAVAIMTFPEITVEKGDFIAIAGQNGIGKSTLIKTLIQLIPKITGEINIKGKPLSHYTRTQLASLISYVSTEVIHTQQVTVRDLVAFGRYPYTNWFGKIQQEDMTIIDEAIALLELGHLSSKYIDEISDGERQRAMIARALAQQTEIIVLDEPTAFLDLPHKHEIINLLGNLSREHGKTIIFTTHDLGIALREADKLWLLSKEHFYQGGPEDLVLNGAISKVFNTGSVSFDNRKGEFTVKKNYRQYFHITGKPIPVHWTRNAVEKDGFTVLEKENADAPEIRVEQTSYGYKWSLEHQGKLNTFNSVLNLRSFIRSNFSNHIIETTV